MTDALDMAGASAGLGIPQAAVLSVAGADLLCIGADNSVAQVREIQTALVGAVRSGRLSEQRLAEAAKAVSGLAVLATDGPPPGSCGCHKTCLAMDEVRKGSCSDCVT